jgi:hypothetical protein
LEEYAASIFKVVRMLMNYIGVGRGFGCGTHEDGHVLWEGKVDGAQSRPIEKEG